MITRNGKPVQPHKSAPEAVPGTDTMLDRAEQWNITSRLIFSSLNRVGFQSLCELENKAYTAAIEHLQNAVKSGRLHSESPETYQVFYFIFNNPQRPTPEQLADKVREVCGVKVTTHGEHAQDTLDRTRLRLPAAPVKPDEGQPLSGVTLPDDPRFWSRDLFPTGRDQFAALRRVLPQMLKDVKQQGRTTESWTAARDWRDPLYRPDALEAIPEGERNTLLQLAWHDLKDRGKGLHPFNVREHAAHLFRVLETKPEEYAKLVAQISTLPTRADTGTIDLRPPGTDSEGNLRFTAQQSENYAALEDAMAYAAKKAAPPNHFAKEAARRGNH